MKHTAYIRYCALGSESDRTMSSDMPLAASAARSSEPVVRASDPVMPSQPFFESSKQSGWITTSTAPPAGTWQLAPRGVGNPFTLGGDRLYGDAMYSTKDRKMLSGNSPVVITITPDDVRDRDLYMDRLEVFLPAGTLCAVTMDDGELIVRPCPEHSDHAPEFVQGEDVVEEEVIGVVAADTFWESANKHDGGASVAIPMVVHGMTDLKTLNYGDEWSNCKAGEYRTVRGRDVTILRPRSTAGVALVQVYIH